ncbi:cytochrome P450 [Fomitopsis serialis]|uniref:cytochrome P450 n=1 Tax=Fomitopsis serialis TaxID=139415 RepID=UPI0020074C66|nr:cytochrome P450 [Neoantrodia serialis]KAH9915125.1 cytochrome P450 [Neoantrodia serialis]
MQIPARPPSNSKWRACGAHVIKQGLCSSVKPSSVGLETFYNMIPLLLILASLTCVFYAFRPRKDSLRQKLPPGPTGVPLLGNLLQLPALRPHPKFLEWASQYGEIFYLKLGGQDVVVLNTAEAADELLSRRSHNYSSRATPHVAHDVLRGGMGLAFLKYDTPWKVARKALQGALGPGPSKNIRPNQECESRVLLYDLICHGNKSVSQGVSEGLHGEVLDNHWFAPVRRYATSVALYAMYGKRVPRFLNNPNLHKIYDIVDNFSQMSQPGNYLADVFPLIRRLPDFLAPWRVKAHGLHLWEMGLWGGLVDDCKAALRSGENRRGFVSSYLNARAAAGEVSANERCDEEDVPGKGLTKGGWIQDDFLAYGAGSALEAGSDTTANTIVTFLLYMLSHPHVLQKARVEIDGVVGTERMPDFDDEERLPYLVACIKETLRHRPATPLAIPHATVEDDVYKDYHIPKGCTVIGNVWAIHRDPERFFNPAAFIPERFYQEGKPTRFNIGPVSNERDIYAFGWGRRFCQGSHIAEASLFITLSRILWGVDFYAPLDPSTKRPILPDVANEEKTWSEGFLSVPHAFNIGFAPRSAKHAELIRKAFDNVQSDWQTMGLEGDDR